MKYSLHTTIITFAGLLLFSVSVNAEINIAITQLQKEWSQIKYNIERKEQEVALENLVRKAAEIRQTQTNNADAYLWEGIILSTYAGSIGTLRALDAVNQSRDALEQSLKLDPLASKGAANTYLGTLYFLVPEWPIAFGDFDLAKKYLNKAIELNPDDIDANYFYGDFLRKQKKYQQAEAAYLKALVAPARPGRDLADAGRRKETKERLAEILSKKE